MTSYIEFEEKGFWVRDSAMEFVFVYLYCNLKDDDSFKNKKEVLKNLKNNSLGYYASYMHLNIQQELERDEIRQFAIKLLTLIFSLNNMEKNEIQLSELCNYETDYKPHEDYLGKSMAKEILISYMLKLAYLFDEYLY